MYYHRAWHALALVTTVVTLVLIVAGGLVTSNDAGLSVPDWPLSFGKLMPKMVGGVFYEHGHRMIAALVGLLTLALAVGLATSGYPSWIIRLAWMALAGVIVQGLLGGLTVLLQLPAVVSVLHACVAQLFFCLVVVLALVTSRGWARRPDPGAWRESAFRLALMATGAVYLQLILGAVLRHSGTVAGAKAVELVSAALVAHLLGALLVVVVLSYASFSILKSDWGGRIAAVLYVGLWLLAIQVLLGVGAYLARVEILTSAQPWPWGVWVTTGHVAVGAIMLALNLVVAMTLLYSSGSKRHPAQAALAGESV